MVRYTDLSIPSPAKHRIAEIAIIFSIGFISITATIAAVVLSATKTIADADPSIQTKVTALPVLIGTGYNFALEKDFRHKTYFKPQTLTPRQPILTKRPDDVTWKPMACKTQQIECPRKASIDIENIELHPGFQTLLQEVIHSNFNPFVMQQFLNTYGSHLIVAEDVLIDLPTPTELNLMPLPHLLTHLGYPVDVPTNLANGIAQYYRQMCSDKPSSANTDFCTSSASFPEVIESCFGNGNLCKSFSPEPSATAPASESPEPSSDSESSEDEESPSPSEYIWPKKSLDLNQIDLASPSVTSVAKPFRA